MPVVVVMPKQGQSVESCIITGLYKKKGDLVKKGEVLFAYETDKASFEEESPTDGTVLALFADEGDEVPVLSRMMIIGDPNEDISALMERDVQHESETAAGTIHEKDQSDQQPLLKDPADNEDSDDNEDAKGDTGQVIGASKAVSPRARNIAAQHALDASRIGGTGPGGRVIERDVREVLADRPKMTALAKKMASEQGTEPVSAGSGLAGRTRAADLGAPVAREVSASVHAIPGAFHSEGTGGEEFEDRKLSNIRKLIARSMHASLQNSAQLTHHLGADARRVLEIRKRIKLELEGGRLETNITLNDLVCFAVIKALKKFPNVNSHFLGDAIRVFNKVHLGIAVDTERGLMVPVIRDADDLSITGLSSRMKETASACRSGNVNPDILSPEAATFTVSNLGNYGVEMFTPVINLPQSAILGVNTIIPRPKELGDGVYAFVPYLGLSLTYDHRALDGGEATRFLKQIATEIETLEI